MTESQQLVLAWKTRLRQVGWPEDAVKRCISDLCEAGYRQCVDDIHAKSVQKEKLIVSATAGERGSCLKGTWSHPDHVYARNKAVVQ